MGEGKSETSESNSEITIERTTVLNASLRKGSLKSHRVCTKDGTLNDIGNRRVDNITDNLSRDARMYNNSEHSHEQTGCDDSWRKSGLQDLR